MAQPIQHAEEQIQKAYLTALAAHARQNITVGNAYGQDYGVDGEFERIDRYESTGSYQVSGVKLPFQSKASKKVIYEDSAVKYDMHAKAYNNIVERNKRGTIPCILIVLALPENINEWLDHTHERYILRRCCFWKSFTGNEPFAPNNDGSKRITIPRSNFLGPTALNDLLNRVAAGGL